MNRILLLSLGILALGLLGAMRFAPASDAHAASTPLWVNYVTYGSVGQGFYWDPGTYQVWTAERGWHDFSPASPTMALPLWVNELDYGSAGGGFYLDPFARQVWTAERGWHAWSPGGASAPPPPPAASGGSFGSGKKIVGADLTGGVTYRTRTASANCYWARLSGLGGTLDEIIANDNTDGPAIVTIGAGDFAFESNRCATWTRDLSAITSSMSAAFPGDGTFFVGVDIGPGTWRSENTGRCYWARLRSFTGTLSDIIANDNEDQGLVTIGAGDKGFLTSRCGTWTKVS